MPYAKPGPNDHVITVMTLPDKASAWAATKACAAKLKELGLTPQYRAEKFWNRRGWYEVRLWITTEPGDHVHYGIAKELAKIGAASQ